VVTAASWFAGNDGHGARALVSSERNAAIRGPFLASHSSRRYEDEGLEQARTRNPTRRVSCCKAQGEAELMTADKRNKQRQRVLKTGKIIFANGSFTVDCIIRNQSQIGARLQVPLSVAIPDRFTLIDTQSGLRKAARVVWRKGDGLGIQFD
jgi:hypothetical protein